MRAGEWHRSDRLLSCLPRDVPPAQAEAALQEALDGLSRAGLLQILSKEHCFADTWAALADCLFADEARQVLLSIGKTRTKG